jgi:hypothetical protein
MVLFKLMWCLEKTDLRSPISGDISTVFVFDDNRLDEGQFRQMVTFHGHIISKDIGYKLT